MVDNVQAQNTCSWVWTGSSCWRWFNTCSSCSLCQLPKVSLYRPLLPELHRHQAKSCIYVQAW